MCAYVYVVCSRACVFVCARVCVCVLPVCVRACARVRVHARGRGGGSFARDALHAVQFLVDLYVSEPRVSDVLHEVSKLLMAVAVEVVGVREGDARTAELIVTVGLVSHKPRDALEAGSRLIEAVSRGQVVHPGLFMAAPAYLSRSVATRDVAPRQPAMREAELEDVLEAENAQLSSELRTAHEENAALQTQVAAFATERHDWALFRDQWEAEKAGLVGGIDEREAQALREKALQEELRAQVLTLRAELQSSRAEVDKGIEQTRAVETKLDAAAAAQVGAQAAWVAERQALERTIEELKSDLALLQSTQPELIHGLQAKLDAAAAAQVGSEARWAADRRKLEQTIEELRSSLEIRQVTGPLAPENGKADWQAEREELLVRLEDFRQRCFEAERSAAPTASPPAASESWEDERKLLLQQLADLRDEMEMQRRQTAEERAKPAPMQWCPVGLEGQLVLKMEKARIGGSPQPITAPSGVVSIVSTFGDASELDQPIGAPSKAAEQRQTPKSDSRAKPSRSRHIHDSLQDRLWSMEAIEGHL